MIDPLLKHRGNLRKVFLSESICGFKRHCFHFENVKKERLTMPKHKGRYPDPAPKCLMNSLMCYERLLTSLHSCGIQHDLDFPNTCQAYFRYLLRRPRLLHSCLKYQAIYQCINCNQCRIRRKVYHIFSQKSKVFLTQYRSRSVSPV